ncbi:threonylcarbamoyl-AMP synthase [Sphaerisporangium album]|uniref:L-threonylcarbamoyladenylate synthase n=1 Tax=Sphaerisporangium album TaxID=509200 RepID=A0A367FLX1_9ACTN|nr:L-threonylcarbamoyladenylate synthase [Sphaerisporangium album]RCG30899.1 threonylcarbamoyl-AMP synthase [Sphaerisporangium album]
MIRRYDCSNSEERATGLADAAAAIRAGELVVIPTDTVYGIGADAFTPSAVAELLEAKGRGRDMPVPVLVGTVRAATALIEDLGAYGQDLIDAFWPGPLTLVCRASRSLTWDLGDSKGTVAVRMPLHALALELLKETGPMAVSSANRSGAPPATTAADAEAQLGEAVGVYLDGGPCADDTPSTIVDLTTPVPRVLRKGAVPVEKLRAIVGYIATDGEPEVDTRRSLPGDTGVTGTDDKDATTSPAETPKPLESVETPKPVETIADEPKPAEATAGEPKPLDKPLDKPVEQARKADGGV